MHTYTVGIVYKVHADDEAHAIEQYADILRDIDYTGETVAINVLVDEGEYENNATEPCEGRGGHGDPRCGRDLGHTGPCDWTE
jgi:hypothetical protein